MTGDDADPVVATAAPRPDFDGALQEFLVGLLTAALHVENETAWRARWQSPPSVEELQAALDALPGAFDLDGGGSRFFQDRSPPEFTDVEPKPIDQLLIDSPGEQGVSFNKDLFVKRARATRLSRPAAALTLLTMQTYAPAGGQGNRTSLRGGGPLTTLVEPRTTEGGTSVAHRMPLWQKLWANVETEAQLATRAAAGTVEAASSIFPWLEATRTSNPKKAGGPTTPGDAHPLQAYFGLPRRIRLELGDAGTCDLTGQWDERLVVGFRSLNYGVQYDGWKHPLSPHYRTKLTETWLPVHGQPGGVVWRDWVSFTLDDPEGQLREPALAVADFARLRARAVSRREFRVHVFGYDVDKMKARGWIESALPAFALPDDERRRLLYSTARSLVEGTSIAGSMLIGAVKSALFQSPEDAKGDFTQIKLDLWSATEADFYAVMRALADESLDADEATTRVDEVRREFAVLLERATTEVFDRRCPPGALDVAALRRRVAARYQLTSTLRGYSKFGETMFEALGIAPPGGGRAARAARKQRTVKEKTA